MRKKKSLQEVHIIFLVYQLLNLNQNSYQLLNMKSKNC